MCFDQIDDVGLDSQGLRRAHADIGSSGSNVCELLVLYQHPYPTRDTTRATRTWLRSLSATNAAVSTSMHMYTRAGRSGYGASEHRSCHMARTHSSVGSLAATWRELVRQSEVLLPHGANSFVGWKTCDDHVGTNIVWRAALRRLAKVPQAQSDCNRLSVPIPTPIIRL
eukprot:1191911-Prorocentrum_minimum.AAC.6